MTRVMLVDDHALVRMGFRMLLANAGPAEVEVVAEADSGEQACADRYGAPRLNVEGKVLGAWGFADACRTCVDQRCIDPCAYDAIKFDQETKEVLILEDACTGCSLCAAACPYDAMRAFLQRHSGQVSQLVAGPNATAHFQAI